MDIPYLVDAHTKDLTTVLQSAGQSKRLRYSNGAGVEELLDALEADRERVESTDIAELEAQIDEAVYELFDLDDEEREIIEEYLEIF